MTIDISNNVILSTALSKVDEGEYFDALTLFARVDSYESMLNQIGCLLELRDIAYAAELYRKLVVKYGFTHNCFADMLKIGDCVEMLWSFFHGEAKGELSKKDDGKIDACEDLLGFYSIQLDEDMIEDTGEELLIELLNDSNATAKQRQIYDVKSPDYFDSLRQRLANAVLSGKMDEARQLQKQYLSIDTDDAPTLEMQQWLCWASSMWDEGLNFALKLAEMDCISLRGLGVNVLVLAHAGSKYNSVLRRQLTKLIDYGEEIDDCDMEDYVRISANALGYDEVTFQLATVLYSHYKDAGCSALRLCSLVFFNCNKPDLAREAVLLLLRALPWDCYGKMMLTFINGNYQCEIDGCGEVGGVLACFDVSHQFGMVAERKLLDKLEADNNVLQQDDYLYLECVLRACRSSLVRGKIESFINQIDVFEKYLDSFVPQDVNQFETFVKNSICSALTEPVLSKNLIHKLLQLGYNDKLQVSIGREYYVLDLTRLKLLSDEIFCEALAFCATIRKVDALKLERAYRRVCKVIDFKFDNVQDTARKVAYCIMALNYKSFPDNGEGVHFVDGDDQLYLEYVLQADK